MKPDFHQLMQNATRLVGSGDLLAATAAIQAALNGTPLAAEPDHATQHTTDDLVIDVEARTPQQARTTQEARPPQDHFIAGQFGNGRMQRAYKLYVPPQAGERPLPLVVMLHGCTQNPDDFAAGTRMNDAARAEGCFVLYPAQSTQANPQGCWNWFKHSHQQRERGEPALIAAMAHEVMAKHAIDPARVYVAGLSAGGAMAAILGTTYPELFAAVGVHSGLAAGAASDLPSALAAMRSGGNGQATSASPPTIVFHGDADTTVHPANGQQVVSASTPAGAREESERHKSPAGRGYTRHVHRSTSDQVVAERWVVHGSPHAWSGGSPKGSYTDPAGPDATQEMLRFFREHPRTAA
jgi:poly(hydroxyalkanoate) depolymerase family esterase